MSGPDRRLAAWSVHLLTASGAVLSLLALVATADGRWREAMLWMIAATVVDGVDGFVARIVGVKRVLPHFDGALLDNLVDYVAYAVVPAFLVVRAGIVPEGTELVAAVAILLASAYQFAQADAKTDDHFFVGFPSYWNVVVVYLLLSRMPPRAALLLVIALALMAFAPSRWVYPSRTPQWRRPTLVLTTLWGACITAAVWRYPEPSDALVTASLLYVAYYAGLSLWLGRRSRAGSPGGSSTP